MNGDELADGGLMVEGGFTGMEMAAAKVNKSTDVQRKNLMARMLFVHHVHGADI